MSEYRVTSTPHPVAEELRQIAQVLKANAMPQEMINMVLATHAGLPVASVDPRSSMFVWVEEQVETPAPEAQPHSLDERREAVLREMVGLEFDKIAHVLSSALNIALAQSGDQATVILRPLVVYREADDKI